MFGVRISKIMYNYIVRIQWPKMTNIMLMRDVVLPKNFLALSIVVSRMKEEEIFLTLQMNLKITLQVTDDIKVKVTWKLAWTKIRQMLPTIIFKDHWM